MTSKNYALPTSHGSKRREAIRGYFETSPAVRLLRAESAPLIIDFLQRTFKTGETIALRQSDLRSRLAIYQDEIHEVDEGMLVSLPEKYITQWTENGWLQRFLESSTPEPQLQLTRHGEAAIRFIDSEISQGNNIVGTEGRLRLIIETLEDIVHGASSDPEKRLHYLTLQREEIDREIRAIDAGKSVQVYRPAQIRERFQTAVSLLKDLQSDFRAVEERFQSIARDVQNLQTLGQDSRGGILGYALDAEDLLKTQDQGISFYAFVSFLFSPAQQNALSSTITELHKLEALEDQPESMSRVRRMVPALLAEADKVMRTTARLSTTLKRLLDARAAADRVRIATLLRDIRQAALQVQVPPHSVQLVVQSELDIASPMSKTFWSPPQTFNETSIVEHPFNQEQAGLIAAAFAKLHRLDFRSMRQHIREETLEGMTITLSELVERFPLRSGVVELLGYLQIAHDDDHFIDPKMTERIVIDDAELSSRIEVAVPHVTYVARAKSKAFGRTPK